MQMKEQAIASWHTSSVLPVPRCGQQLEMLLHLQMFLHC